MRSGLIALGGFLAGAPVGAMVLAITAGTSSEPPWALRLEQKLDAQAC